MQANIPKARRYWTLDAMRGIAAIVVVAGHYDQNYARYSYLAVDFFFMLSAFVLSQRYADELSTQNATFWFLGERIKRLYPLFAVGLAIGLTRLIFLCYIGSALINRSDLVLSALTNFVFLPSPSFWFISNSLGGLFPIDDPAWSMFWELLINIVFAAYLVRLRSLGLAIFMIAAFVALCACAGYYGSMNIGWEWQSFIGGGPRVAFSFAFGMLAYRLIGSRPVSPKSYLALLPPMALIFCLVVPISENHKIAYGLLFCGALSPLIMASGILIDIPDPLRKLSGFLGYMSYPVYITHRPIVLAVLAISHQFGLRRSVGFAAAASLIAVISYCAATVADRISVAARRASRRNVDQGSSAGPAEA